MLGRKSSAVLSVLGLVISSTSAYAMVSTSNIPMSTSTVPSTTIINNESLVNLPGSRPGFEFSLAFLALKPGATNLNYVIYNKELPTQSPTWLEKEIQPESSGAFELGGRYNFTEGRDINLNWTHLSSSTSASVAAPDASYFLGPDYEIGPAGLTTRNATGKAQFNYDVVNLDAGQTVDFGRHVETRFFIGLSDAFLREQVNATYSGATVTGAHQGPYSIMQEVTANFTGLGPRVGFDASYITQSGFGFIGQAAASVLIGSSYSKTTYVGSSQELKDLYNQALNFQSIRDQNVTQVIPGFDAKLGAIYSRAFSKGTLFTLAGGYQAAVYVNAINQYLPASLVVPLSTGGIFVSTMSHTQSNYSVQGPFVEGTLRF